MTAGGGRVAALALAGVIASVACTSLRDPTPTPSVSSARSNPVAASSSPVATPTPTSPAPADGPPVALLAAEGGDAVAGQLGTYTWKETGSDAPWLPGARIAVGMGEPLSVGVGGGTPVGAWVARARPSGTSLPARPLGDGSGIVEFGAPAAGVWSLAVEVHFADGSGVATYFWELHIG